MPSSMTCQVTLLRNSEVPWTAVRIPGCKSHTHTLPQTFCLSQQLETRFDILKQQSFLQIHNKTTGEKLTQQPTKQTIGCITSKLRSIGHC